MCRYEDDVVGGLQKARGDLLRVLRGGMEV